MGEIRQRAWDVFHGNANLPIGILDKANQEIGVPRRGRFLNNMNIARLPARSMRLPQSSPPYSLSSLRSMRQSSPL